MPQKASYFAAQTTRGMFGRYKFKINTAGILLLAFVFRLLFVNIGLLTSTSSSQGGKFLSAHTASILRRKQVAQVSSQPNANGLSAVEFYAEVSENEEEMAKANSPAILYGLIFFIKNIFYIPKSTISFDIIKCKLFPKKYLEISILRI